MKAACISLYSAGNEDGIDAELIAEGLAETCTRDAQPGGWLVGLESAAMSNGLGDRGTAGRYKGRGRRFLRL